MCLAAPGLALLALGGCAAPVPGQGGLSGRALVVTIQTAGPMNPAYHYYFLLNLYTPTGTQTARGPIAIFGPATSIGGFGNGFATGSPGGAAAGPGQPTDYGLTDYVEYGPDVPNGFGIGLFHFPGNPNAPASAIPEGRPVTYTLPSFSDPTNIPAQTTLTFTLKLSQLFPNITNPAQAQQAAAAIQFLQANIVATNVVPIDQATATGKEVDSMGNTLDPNQQSSYLILDLQNNTIWRSTDTTSALSPEQAGDVWPAGSSNDALDLTSWTIQLVTLGG